MLGAGLGERLRPLTDQLPKPLIPVFHKPLITYAFDHLLAAGVREFVINTHHLPEAYARTFPTGSYRGAPLHFRHESPVRLETAGGIANVRDLIGDEPFLVYNGDILTDLPLEPLLREHRERKNLVTLALRSTGPALHIALDQSSGRVTDIRNMLGTGQQGGLLFTGVYVVEPAFFDWLTPGKVESVIPIFLKMIQHGAGLGGVIIDDGHWWDLGSRSAYLEAHKALQELNSHFPLYASLEDRRAGRQGAIDDDARIDPASQLAGLNVVGAGARIGSGAALENCIIWPDAVIGSGTRLTNCIVRSGVTVPSGDYESKDL